MQSCQGALRSLEAQEQAERETQPPRKRLLKKLEFVEACPDFRFQDLANKFQERSLPVCKSSDGSNDMDQRV